MKRGTQISASEAIILCTVGAWAAWDRVPVFDASSPSLLWVLAGCGAYLYWRAIVRVFAEWDRIRAAHWAGRWRAR